MEQEWRQGTYLISTDKKRIDLTVVHNYLSTSYWAAGIPLEHVQKSIEHSLSFGVYKVGANTEQSEDYQQVGFARVITDYTTFAYISDVFILETFRGQGLSKWLMNIIVAHPDLQGLRRWMLLTRDAHGLYQKVGFIAAKSPERYMERYFPDVYKKESSVTTP